MKTDDRRASDDDPSRLTDPPPPRDDSRAPKRRIRNLRAARKLPTRRVTRSIARPARSPKSRRRNDRSNLLTEISRADIRDCPPAAVSFHRSACLGARHAALSSTSRTRPNSRTAVRNRAAPDSRFPPAARGSARIAARIPRMIDRSPRDLFSFSLNTTTYFFVRRYAPHARTRG